MKWYYCPHCRKKIVVKVKLDLNTIKFKVKLYKFTKALMEKFKKDNK